MNGNIDMFITEVRQGKSLENFSGYIVSGFTFDKEARCFEKVKILTEIKKPLPSDIIIGLIYKGEELKCDCGILKICKVCKIHKNRWFDVS